MIEMEEDVMPKLNSEEPSEATYSDVQNPEGTDTSGKRKMKKGNAMNSVRLIIGGDILAGHWFREYFWYILMIVVMCLIYVGNRYSCEAEMIETTKLEDSLRDYRFKALTLSSQLKDLIKPSVIEKNVNDTSLKRSVEPIYSMEVGEEAQQ